MHRNFISNVVVPILFVLVATLSALFAAKFTHQEPIKQAPTEPQTEHIEEEVIRIVLQTGSDIKLFLTALVEDGKRQNEIRQDFSTENIVESLVIMYMGIQYSWLIFANDDTDLIFEKNFDITWAAIKYP